ncbi:MAG: hypothetical protein PUD20_10300 [bacterium]|nr:hypothetical protein [bacterium]
MYNENCPCKRTECERFGRCDACKAHHAALSGRKGLTRCEKLALKEQKETAKAEKKAQKAERKTRKRERE